MGTTTREQRGRLFYSKSGENAISKSVEKACWTRHSGGSTERTGESARACEKVCGWPDLARGMQAIRNSSAIAAEWPRCCLPVRYIGSASDESNDWNGYIDGQGSMKRFGRVVALFKAHLPCRHPPVAPSVPHSGCRTSRYDADERSTGTLRCLYPLGAHAGFRFLPTVLRQLPEHPHNSRADRRVEGPAGTHWLSS